MPDRDAFFAGVRVISDRMQEKPDFHRALEGATFSEIEWHSGIAARDSTRKCLAAKK